MTSHRCLLIASICGAIFSVKLLVVSTVCVSTRSLPFFLRYSFAVMNQQAEVPMPLKCYISFHSSIVMIYAELFRIVYKFVLTAAAMPLTVRRSNQGALNLLAPVAAE